MKTSGKKAVKPTKTRTLTVETPHGPSPALLRRPADAFALVVLAHGAGAGMRHTFMESLARALADEGVATLRYSFPYLRESGTQASFARPDPPAVLHATVRNALAAARRIAPDLPCFLGGKSMGGRMSSEVMAEEAKSAKSAKSELGFVRGIVFFGFPLHLAKKPATRRAEHLAEVCVPMLFLQGDRDALADLALLRPLLAKLGRPSPRLHVIAGADHGFGVLVRSGRTDADVLRELARTTASFLREVTGV